MVYRPTDATPLSNPLLERCWYDPQEQLRWNLNRNSYIFIQKNAFENVVYKIPIILSRLQCVKMQRSLALQQCHQIAVGGRECSFFCCIFVQTTFNIHHNVKRPCGYWQLVDISSQIITCCRDESMLSCCKICNHTFQIHVRKNWDQSNQMKKLANEISFCVTGHLCGEFTGHRWIPRTKSQWRRALVFSLICAWMNGWLNNREAGDLRRHRAHYEVTVIICHFGRTGNYVFVSRSANRGLFSWIAWRTTQCQTFMNYTQFHLLAYGCLYFQRIDCLFLAGRKCIVSWLNPRDE